MPRAFIGHLVEQLALSSGEMMGEVLVEVSAHQE
jgi:hypothetical protein